MIRKKISALKEKQKVKNVIEQKEITKELITLEDNLVRYDTAMKKAYKIHSKLDYVLDVTALSIYMLITPDDLKRIGEQNNDQLEKAFKKSLQKK